MAVEGLAALEMQILEIAKSLSALNDRLTKVETDLAALTKNGNPAGVDETSATS